jgi:hypothetical protein
MEVGKKYSTSISSVPCPTTTMPKFKLMMKTLSL